MHVIEQVKSTVADVLEWNRTADSSLEGGAFCATIERPSDGEPWVQIKTGVLNIF